MFWLELIKLFRFGCWNSLEFLEISVSCFFVCRFSPSSVGDDFWMQNSCKNMTLFMFLGVMEHELFRSSQVVSWRCHIVEWSTWCCLRCHVLCLLCWCSCRWKDKYFPFHILRRGGSGVTISLVCGLSTASHVVDGDKTWRFVLSSVSVYWLSLIIILRWTRRGNNLA